MDRGSGRSLFKNPPQPYMCIQDSLVGSHEPCFINVLSWEKISQPSHPTHQIPLFGGMKVKNSSLNSLAITNLYDGIKDGRQPLIFAVCANTTILQLIGKGTKEPNERDALIFVILEFIEAMNIGIKFQCKFKVLPDRDVVGELKDIWYIIQSRRDQEKIELANAESRKSSSDKLRDPTNGHWNYRDSDGERKHLVKKEFGLKNNVSSFHYSPHLNSNSSGKDYHFYNQSPIGTKNKQVTGEKCLPVPINQKAQSPAMKDAIDWGKRAYTSSHLATINYGLSSTAQSVENITLKPLPPSFNESIEMMAREEKSAAMNQRNKTETIGPICSSHKEDKTLLQSFPYLDSTEKNKCEHIFDSDERSPSKECLHHATVSAGQPYHVLNSYESDLAMCNQLWNGIATEFPSLDVGRNMSKASLSHEGASQELATTKTNDSGISNLLVNRKHLIANIIDSMTELSNDAGFDHVSDEILDVQESNLVQELTEFDAIPRIKHNRAGVMGRVDKTKQDFPEDQDLRSEASRTADFLDKTYSVSLGHITDDLNKLPKLNKNIPSLSAVFGNQVHTHLVNEVNRNIDLSQHTSDLNSINSELSEVEHFAMKSQKDSNENVDA